MLLTTQSIFSKTEQLATYTAPYTQLGFKLHFKQSPLNSEQATPLGHSLEISSCCNIVTASAISSFLLLEQRKFYLTFVLLYAGVEFTFASFCAYLIALSIIKFILISFASLFKNNFYKTLKFK